MKAGILPQLVATQVKNTAAWLWEEPRAAAVTGALDVLLDLLTGALICVLIVVLIVAPGAGGRRRGR